MTPGGTMTQDELIRAVRLDLTAEQDAVSLYTAHAGATEDESVRKVFLSIADEERVHIGELQALIARLNPAEPGKLREGAKEVADQTAGTAKMIRVTLRKQEGSWVTIRGRRVNVRSEEAHAPRLKRDRAVSALEALRVKAGDASRTTKGNPRVAGARYDAMSDALKRLRVSDDPAALADALDQESEKSRNRAQASPNVPEHSGYAIGLQEAAHAIRTASGQRVYWNQRR